MTRASTVPPDMGSGLGGAVSSSRLGRAATHSGISGPDEEGRAGAWSSLASWLRNGRLERGLSIADIARTTKIQARILEDLEAGVTEGLPADVFVRGFVRNYARCVGLSEGEALARYSACSRDAGPVASPAATAVAEMYAPTTKRMSTVVPVAPGSPAAEVHASSPNHARPGYARAATAPGSALSSSPRILRAPTEGGEDLAALTDSNAREMRRTSAQMAAVTPAVIYPRPAVGSGIVSTSGSTAGVTSAVEPEVSTPIAAPVPVVAVAQAPVAPLVEPKRELAIESKVESKVEAATADEEAKPSWPSSNAKKRKAQKRKEREERQARRNPRAQTVRPMLESDLYEVVPASVVAAAIESAKIASAPAPAPIEVEAPAAAVEGWPSAEPAVIEPSVEAAPAVAVAVAVASDEAIELSEPVIAAAAPVTSAASSSEVWIPKMPPAPRPSRAFVAPTLTIDDADPESASQLQDDRSRDRDGREPTRRTFLPPILLESQDRANRQGGLTLAVIILLIAATLTLSYLMRRPSTGGAGMTQLDAPVTSIDFVG